MGGVGQFAFQVGAETVDVVSGGVEGFLPGRERHALNLTDRRFLCARRSGMLNDRDVRPPGIQSRFAGAWPSEVGVGGNLSEQFPVHIL